MGFFSDLLNDPKFRSEEPAKTKQVECQKRTQQVQDHIHSESAKMKQVDYEKRAQKSRDLIFSAPAKMRFQLDQLRDSIDIKDGVMIHHSSGVTIEDTLAEIYPEIDGINTLINKLSDLIPLVTMGNISNCYIADKARQESGFSFHCDFVFNTRSPRFILDVSILNGHRANVAINGNTNYTVTSVIEYIDKNYKPKRQSKADKAGDMFDMFAEKLEKRLHNGGRIDDDTISIIEGVSLCSMQSPLCVKYGTNCYIKRVDSKNAQLVTEHVNIGYYKDKVFYNFSKTSTENIICSPRIERLADKINSIISSYFSPRRRRDKAVAAFEMLKSFPDIKSNGDVLLISSRDDKYVRAKLSPDNNDILLRLSDDRVLNISKYAFNQGVDDFICTVRFLALLDLYHKDLSLPSIG